MINCYAYGPTTTSGTNLSINANGYIGGTARGDYIVYKNMDFGSDGAVSVNVEYAVKGDYTGTLSFRKGSKNGEILASFETATTGGWETWKTISQTVNVPSDATGTFDLYVVISGTFGNLKSFTFKEAQSAYENVMAYSDAISKVGFIEENQDAATGLNTCSGYANHTGDYDDLNARYMLNFKEGYAKQLVLNSFIQSSGKIRIYNDCVGAENLLQEISLSATDGEFAYTDTIIDLNEAIYNLQGAKNICLAFDNSIGIVLKSFKFIQSFDPFLGDSEVNVAYIGGSITAGAKASAPEKNWVSIVGQSLKSKFGTDRTFNNFNVGIGGTGSDLGLMRLQNDVISKNPDMVFIEFAVNDAGKAEGLQQMESIVKTLQTMDSTPYVVIVLTSTLGLTGTEYKRYHKEVSQYYGIPVVDLDAIISEDNSVVLGDLLADGVHPNDTGYAYYAEKINEFLEANANFVRPEKKSLKLSPNSKAVDIKTVNPSEFSVSGVNGVDYSYDGEKLNLLTDNATASVTYTGDIAGITDYIHNVGGKYTVDIDGRRVYTRNTYYNVSTPVYNMGCLDMTFPYREHTILFTKIADSLENSKVILDKFNYNSLKNDDQEVFLDTVEAYSSTSPVSARSYSETSGIKTGTSDSSMLFDDSVNDCIGNANKGRWLCYKNVDLSQGIGKIYLTYATKSDLVGTAVMHIGSKTGPVIGEVSGFNATSTANWYTWKTIEASANTNYFGVTDVYVYFTNSIGNFKSFYFTPSDSLSFPNSILNVKNYSEISSDISITNNSFSYLTNDSYVKYTVDAKEGFTEDAVIASVSSVGKTGNIIIRDGGADSANVVAEIPVSNLNSWSIYAPVSGYITDYGKTLKGAHDLYITFDGDNDFAQLEYISFVNSNNTGETFNVSNVDYMYLLNIESTYIRDNDKIGSWACWSGVNFGNAEKLIDVTFTYAVPASNEGSIIEMRLDSPVGELVGRGVMSATGGWAKIGTITVPMLKGVSGIHTVYIMVASSWEQKSTDKAGNIQSFSFADSETNYHINYINNENSYDAVLTAIAENDDDSIMFIQAIYDSNGNLIEACVDSKALDNGVNVFNTSLPKSVINGIDTFKVKAFVFDNNIKPLKSQSILYSNVE